jgi:hypothetical protein
MPLEGANFSENAKPLAQAYALAEIEKLNLARELQELREQLKVAREEGWQQGYADRVAEEVAGYGPYEK